MSWKACFTAILFVFFPLLTFSKEVVNVYIWSNYIPEKVVQQFEKETGIDVQLSNFDGNEIMYTKMKADPRAGYDVIVPSNYYVNRMIKEGMIQKLNKDHFPNIRYLNPLLLHEPYDPNNEYSLPFVWGATGIIVNKKYWDPTTIRHWSDLWQSRFKNQLLLLDDPREVFAMAFFMLNYSINTQDPSEIYRAFLELKKLAPNIRLYNADAISSIYIDEDATIGMAWSGDAFLATKENPNLTFIYPEEGFSLWTDCFVIPTYAPHLRNAEIFINFLMRPDIAQYILLTEGYPIANLAAINSLPDVWKKNPILNPDAKTLKRAKMMLDIGDAATLYQKYWQLLKLGST